MLEKLTIKRFQAHESLSLDIDPLITTIVGPSDVGKSSIVRALRWVSLNVPVGCLVRHGAKSAKVELAIDGHEIVRLKGKDNLYRVDGRELRSFRTEVPTTVQRLLRMDELNFQGQHDQSYWFCETPGEVSRRLNDLVDLAIVDEALSKAASAVRDAKSKLAAWKEELAESLERRKSLAWIKDCDAELAEVEQAGAGVSELQDRIDAVSQLVRETEQAAKDSERLQGAAKEIDSVASLAGALVDCDSKYRKLAKAITDADRAKTEASVPIPDLSLVDKAKAELESAKASFDLLHSAVEEAELRAAAVQELTGRAKEYGRRLTEACGGRCPLCGSPLPADSCVVC